MASRPRHFGRRTEFPFLLGNATFRFARPRVRREMGTIARLDEAGKASIEVELGPGDLDEVPDGFLGVVALAIASPEVRVRSGDLLDGNGFLSNPVWILIED